MRNILIVLFFVITGVYVAHTIVGLQLQTVRLTAFVAMVLSSILLVIKPNIALYCLIACVAFYDPRFAFPFIRLWLHQWIILASTIFLAAYYIYQRKKVNFFGLDLVLGAFTATYFISFLNSPDVAVSIRWTLYFMILIGGYFLIRLAVNTKLQLRNVMLFLILCATATAFISFFNPIVGSRVGSLVLVNPNALGNYLTMILPPAVALLLYGSLSRGIKAFLIVGIIAIGISIIMTLSRSSWVGSLCGLLMLGIFKPRLKYWLLLALILVPVAFIPRVKERAIEDRSDAGIFYRRTKIQIAWQMFKENPVLGHGPGSFQFISSGREEWGVVAHSGIENMYMQILSEGGSIQAVFFVLLVVYVIYLSFTTMAFLEQPGLLYAIVLGCLAGFGAALGIGAGENAFIFPKSNWIVGLELGAILKVREIARLKNRARTSDTLINNRDRKGIFEKTEILQNHNS